MTVSRNSLANPYHARGSRVLGPASDGEERRACQRRVPASVGTRRLPPASDGLGQQPGLRAPAKMRFHVDVNVDVNVGDPIWFDTTGTSQPDNWSPGDRNWN